MNRIRLWIYFGLFVPVGMAFVVALIPAMIVCYYYDKAAGRTPVDPQSMSSRLDGKLFLPMENLIRHMKIWARLEDPMFWKILKRK